MSDTQNPAVAKAPVPGAIDSAVRGIFDQVFNTPPGTSDSPVPPAPDGTVILSEQPRIAQEEVQPTPTVEEIKILTEILLKKLSRKNRKRKKRRKKNRRKRKKS